MSRELVYINPSEQDKKTGGSLKTFSIQFMSAGPVAAWQPRAHTNADATLHAGLGHDAPPAVRETESIRFCPAQSINPVFWGN